MKILSNVAGVLLGLIFNVVALLSHFPRQRRGIGWVAAAGGRALLVPTLHRTRSLLPFASGHEVTSKCGRYAH